VTGTPHSLIAVVDDEAGVRTMLRRVLRHAEYDVAEFASGQELLDALAVRVPACVILDVHMPGLSGLETQLRMRCMGFDAPAIFITASDPALDRAVAEARGASLLRKPFASDRLLEAVQAALRAGSGGL
jgi:FixJ family two-component response regulator